MVLEEDVGCCGGQTKPGPAMTTVYYTLILPCKQQPPRATSQVHKGVGRGGVVFCRKDTPGKPAKNIFKKTVTVFVFMIWIQSSSEWNTLRQQRRKQKYRPSTKVFKNSLFPYLIAVYEG